MNRCAVTLVLLCLSLGVAACAQPKAADTTKTRVRGEYDPQTGKLTRLESDSNGDGKPDTWGYMDGTRLVRVEVDEDGDGKVDRWEYYDGSTGSNPVVLERVERSTRRDGKVSRWEHFEHGQLTRVEEDTDGDGKVDKWERYTNGTLASLAIDTQHRGSPDRRLIYRADGTLDRIEDEPTGGR